ncbi:MAG: hypothetical protein ACYDHZ_10740 [Dehalococcoidia bacterium]
MEINLRIKSEGPSDDVMISAFLVDIVTRSNIATAERVPVEIVPDESQEKAEWSLAEMSEYADIAKSTLARMIKVSGGGHVSGPSGPSGRGVTATYRATMGSIDAMIKLYKESVRRGRPRNIWED